MRKQIVAGNWKMNLTVTEGQALVQQVLEQLPELSAQKQVIFGTPFLHLCQAVAQTKDTANVGVAAQNCHHQASGAYTGEIAAGMLQAAGVQSVIIGHSERRMYNHEDNALLAKKVDAALAANLHVIFCCGESLDIRDADTQNAFVEQQLNESIFHLSAEQMAQVTIAYEPIWAIGTGRTASAAQAQDMHAHIRGVLAAKYGESISQQTSILYGGSCKASNAVELFSCPDVDGGLIGGASLLADDFLGIIRAMVSTR
ncbi:triose-phosphate isomerase [Rurimicrobium arvi]|uniref:Triosephosphate isomerase n=1 Tax=Rurimicrobium arvi TaxID=2049916 RepID=A0ABP8MTD3_9BACT